MKSVMSVSLVLVAGLFTSTHSSAVSWKPECNPGQTFENPQTHLYRCRVQNGTRTEFGRASCAPQTPNLQRHSFRGYNYACGLNTGVVGELWNEFKCPGGLSRVANANSAARTCSRNVPTYNYLEPHFKQIN